MKAAPRIALVFHTIPVGQKHTLTPRCSCCPKVQRHPVTGCVMRVSHRPGRGYRGLWRIKFVKAKGARR